MVGQAQKKGVHFWNEALKDEILRPLLQGEVEKVRNGKLSVDCMDILDMAARETALNDEFIYEYYKPEIGILSRRSVGSVHDPLSAAQS